MNVITPPLSAFRADSSWLKAGATTPKSGLYQVHHYAHRGPHTVFIEKGTVLPHCQSCGGRVQYAPLIAGERLELDRELVPSKTA